MTRQSPWRLSLLGHAQLLGPDARALPLSRTTLFTLAVLALDGRTPRSRLAALLWPDTVEAGARNNLVHLLRRLRSQAGADLITMGTDLELSEEVTVDVHVLKAAPSTPGTASLTGNRLWQVVGTRAMKETQ